jgi:Leucine-rich repeat (LRR) protein
MLACLDVRSNVLSALPTELSQCKGLEEVVCSMNRFSSIPAVLYTIPSLVSLIFSDNQIGTIDVAALRRLPALNCLELTNNSINQVPPELGLMEGLNALKLEGNCFKIPRPAQLAQPTASLLAYLRGRIP